MAQKSNFQNPRILRQAKEMHLQGYPDAVIIDRFLISPATFYRYKSGWLHSELRVGVYDFLHLPKSAYGKAPASSHPGFYDLEFARGLALKMNRSLKIVFKRFDQLLLGLQNCEYDLAFGLLAASDFRLSKANFTDQYLEKSGDDGCVLSRRTHPIRSSKDLGGKRIAVLGLGANEDYLRKLRDPSIVIRTYDRYEICHTALALNWVDAIFGPEPLMLVLKRKGFPFETSLGRLSFVTKTCIAVNRENESLTEQVNDQIQKLRVDFIPELSQKVLRP